MTRYRACALVLVFVLLSASSGVAVGLAPRGGDFYKVALLTQAMVAAWLMSLGWMLWSRQLGSRASALPGAASSALAGLFVASAIGIPSYFMAFSYTGSVLTVARVTFIDYTLVPVFVALIARFVDGRFGVDSRAEAVGMATSLVGSLLLVLGASSDEPVGTKDSNELGRFGHLAIGLALTATTSFCGAAGLHFGRCLRELPTSAIVHTKFAGAAAAMLAVCLFKQAWPAFVAWEHYAWSLLLGLLMFFPLAIVYCVLRREVVTLLVPYLFLVPVASFALSALADRSMVGKTPSLEWLGMCIITAGFLVAALPTLRPKQLPP